MNLQDVIGPAVVAAIVSGCVSIVAAAINNRHAHKMHQDRLKADETLAEKKFHYEKALAEWKRKSDLAETVLASFYKARSIFANARSPVARGGEGASRERSENETADESAFNDAIYAPYEKLTNEISFLSELNALRFRFSALFGPEADQAFANIVSAYNQVQNATYQLLRPNNRLGDTRRERYERVIGWDTSDADEIGTQIDDAVQIIERLSRPVLTNGI